MHPNPIKDVLIISNTTPITAIEVTSILGKQILSKSINTTEVRVDLSQLSDGVYFVKIRSKAQEKIVKIIKE